MAHNPEEQAGIMFLHSSPDERNVLPFCIFSLPVISVGKFSGPLQAVSGVCHEL